MGQRQIGMCVPAIIDVILNWVQDQVLSIDDVVDRDAEIADPESSSGRGSAQGSA